MPPILVQTDCNVLEQILKYLCEDLGLLNTMLQFKLDDRLLMSLESEYMQINDIAYLFGQIHGMRRALEVMETKIANY